MGPSPVTRGSIVLIRYPFTDLTAAKVRPALVITPDVLIPLIDDILCLFISSSTPSEVLPTDLYPGTTEPSFAQTGLKANSILRAHKLALLHKRLVLRVLGEADSVLLESINSRLRIALGLASQ